MRASAILPPSRTVLAHCVWTSSFAGMAGVARDMVIITAMSDLNSKNSGITGWPEGERPRERLLAQGADALSDAELIAIILRVGVQGMNAVAMGRNLLEKFGTLEKMTQAPLSALLEVKGLKKAKAAQLQAAMEIAKRVASRRVATTGDRIAGTEQAAEYFKVMLRRLPEEHFRVLYLNRRNIILDNSFVVHGDVAEVAVSLRQIVARALQTSASAVIAAHNHPSGVAEPSEADRLITKDLIAAFRPLGIRVLDHLIIAGDKWYSHADSGALDELEMECLSPGKAATTSAFVRDGK